MQQIRSISFNKKVFIITFLCLICLTAVCLVAAGAEEEGTGDSGILSKTGAGIYLILRFPMHILLKDFIKGFPVFITTLMINCCLYALLAERTYSLIKGEPVS